MRCSRCGQDKPAEEFRKDLSRRHGVSRICRGCGAADRKARKRRAKARRQEEIHGGSARQAEERRVLEQALEAWDGLGVGRGER